MAGVFEVILIYGGVGFLLGFMAMLGLLTSQRKTWNTTYINLDERQGNIVGEIKEGRYFKEKNGQEHFVLRNSIKDVGLGAFNSKKYEITQVPEKVLAIVDKFGGNIMLTYNAAGGVKLPMRLIKSDQVDAIAQDTDWRNWYKGTVEKYLISKILNPKSSWQEKAPLIFAGTIIGCIILMTIYGTVVFPALMKGNAELAGSVANVVKQLNIFGSQIGTQVAATGGQVLA